MASKNSFQHNRLYRHNTNNLPNEETEADF